MLLRLVVIAVAVWLLVRLARKLLAPPEPRPPVRPFEEVVRCAHCGLHVPKEQALHHADAWYCSPEHRDAAGRD